MKTFIVTVNSSLIELKDLIKTKYEDVRVDVINVPHDDVMAVFKTQEEPDVDSWNNEGGSHPLNPENR